MVSIGIGKVIAQRFALRVTANVVGMTRSAELNHQKS